MKKILKTLLIIVLLVSSYNVYADEAPLTGLQEIDGKYYYYNESGKLQKSKFINIENKLYFFSYADGSMIKSGFFTKANKTYYADTTTGEIYKGLHTINGTNYYFNDLGVMQKGLITLDDKNYYFDNNGKMAKSKFITIDNKLYFFSYTDGSMLKSGFFTKAGKKYYASTETGEIYRGLNTINNANYYFNDQGVMQTGLITTEDNSYYFDNNGKMVKSKFITIDNKLYFFSYADGSMQKNGFFTKAGKTYYASPETGEILKGLNTINGTNYYFNDLGVMQKGLITLDDKDYYFDNNGKMVRSKFIKIDNKLYFFSYADGSMLKSGWFTKAGKKYYADKSSGEIATSIKKIDNINYFFSKTGVLEEENYGNEYTKVDDYLVVENTSLQEPTNKKELYNIIFTRINAGYKIINIQCATIYTDCIDDFLAMFDDQSIFEMSYLANPFNGTYSYSYSWGTNQIGLRLKSDYTEETIQEINTKMDEIEQKLYTAGDTNVDKIKKLNDYIVANTEYDYGRANNNDTTYQSHLAYGALIEGHAVCSGYAETMALFLDRLQIKNYRVVSADHAWNALYLNNNWYHLDVTWNDSGDYSNNDYYLISTEELHRKDSSIHHEFDLNFYQELA